MAKIFNIIILQYMDYVWYIYVIYFICSTVYIYFIQVNIKEYLLY